MPDAQRLTLTSRAGDGLIGAMAAGAIGVAVLGRVGGMEAPPSGVPCLLRAVVGIPCPFCGLTRSLFAAGAGDWSRSLDLSPIGPLVLAAALVALLVVARSWVASRPVRWPPGVVVAVGAVVAVSWVVQLTKGVP